MKPAHRVSCGTLVRALVLWASANLAGASAVTLTPEEVTRMGIVTAPVAAATRAPEARGFGVVLAHETVAQVLADLEVAAATERQSRSALLRVRHLAGTAGAMPADNLEAAERQSTVDQSALVLARRKLSSAVGGHPPWGRDDRSPTLAAVASGGIKMVRVTFPLGSVEAIPASLQLARMDSRPGGSGERRWSAAAVWGAPADSNVPGRSVFALLKEGDAAEGERLLAWTAVGVPGAGVLIPASAIVISAGRYWCFVETRAGVFERRAVATDIPVDDGYFVRAGVGPGAKVVVASAGTLLARELNPATAAE